METRRPRLAALAACTLIAASAPAARAEASAASQSPATSQAAAAPDTAHTLPERFDVRRPEIRRFAREVARRDRLSSRRVLRLIAAARPQPQILDLMTRQPERVLEWWEYREHFLTEKRIDQGVRFWLEHRDVLERVAAEQGVPPEYLVAILGCETFYGRNTGRDRVLDALATLAFEYPPRAEYFRGELEQFLLLARETHLDPLVVKGSYSGAMGAPQFMPSAYRRYAVDESHDHRRDLWSDWADVFASIAHYLRVNGWEPGAPVIAEARLDPDAPFQLDARGVLEGTVAELNAQGVRLDLSCPAGQRTAAPGASAGSCPGEPPGSTPAMLVSAEQADGPAYRVGFNNFRVIMRYNRSTRYAMAVNDLAASIAARVRGAPDARTTRAERAGGPPG